MFKFLLAAVTIASVAAGENATCAATDAAKPMWSTVSNECLAAATDDTTCAAIDAAKSKWLQSSTSCVACIIPASPDGDGCFVTGCTGKVCGKSLGLMWGTKALFLPVQPSTGTVCSKGTPNTCVAPAKEDADCAAIDPAFPLSSLFADQATSDRNWPSSVACVAIPKDDATCAYYNGPTVAFNGPYVGTPLWSTVNKKCVRTPIDDATCAAFDAAKSNWTTSKYCGDGSPPITDGAKMCGAGTTYDKTKKKCETILPTDIELAKMCGAGTTYDKAKKKCEMASPLVTCGDGTTLTANKCGITSPTDVELAKMWCGEGTKYDKAKKKCVTDPTSRCTPGLTNTTKSADVSESSAGSHFVSRAATLIATVIVVLFCKL